MDMGRPQQSPSVCAHGKAVAPVVALLLPGAGIVAAFTGLALELVALWAKDAGLEIAMHADCVAACGRVGVFWRRCVCVAQV